MKYYVVVFSLLFGLCSIHNAEAASKKALPKKAKSKIAVLRLQKEKPRKALAKKRALFANRTTLFRQPSSSIDVQQPFGGIASDPSDDIIEEIPVETRVCDNSFDTLPDDTSFPVTLYTLSFPGYQFYQRSASEISADVASQAAQKCNASISRLLPGIANHCRDHGCSTYVIAGTSCTNDLVRSDGPLTDLYAARMRISFRCTNQPY